MDTVHGLGIAIDTTSPERNRLFGAPVESKDLTLA